MPILGRISSNKENAALSGAPNTFRKPRLAGMGRAPSARPRLLSTSKHNAKAVKVVHASKLATYRKASIVRGTRVASSLSSSKALPKAVTKVATKAAEPVAQPAAKIPTHLPIKVFIISDPSGPLVRIPTALPKPDIAPNLHMTMTDGTVVVSVYVHYRLGHPLTCQPTLFVQHRLSYLLPRIHTVGSYYEPYPHIPSPPEADSAMADGLRKSFAWGVPYIINGHDTEGSLAYALTPFQPDVCLAIRKRNDKTSPFHVTAINYTVYAAFFSYFPRRFNIAPSARLAKALAGSDTDEEEDMPSPMSVFNELPRAGDIDALEADDRADTASSTSDASAAAALEVGEHIHLPLLAIELPDPDSFNLIHERLHCPYLKWQPALLGLGLFHAVSPEQAQAHLAKRSVTELINLLKKIHGVWGNLVALGLENGPMWSELGSAYSLVVSILLLRANKQQSAAAEAPATTQ